ncbi:MAG: sigma 54-interacting transcriptional regulator [Massilia sp.]
MNDLDNTLTTQLFASDGGREVALLGLTILWHPDVSRIGDQFIGPPAEGTVEVSRYAPLFFRGDHNGIAIGHRAIARAPLQLRRMADDSIALTPPDSRMSVEVNGVELNHMLRLDRDTVARGVVLGLGGQVLLCLHWMTSLPRANALPGLLGVSSGAIATRELIRQVAATELSVLLLGETGTGKDVAARAIHAASERKHKRMVTVNMATLSDTLAAADLFGAHKGAYTGAQSARLGLFAEADGGTLFLDELGDTPASVQPMLLRVLETGRYRPLGASEDAQSSARLIAATDQDLDAKEFNQPLLRRMESFVIRVPALRERREDIGVLLLDALRQADVTAEELAALPAALISEICNYEWPGNIRQLANVARRALMAQRAGQAPALAHFIRGPLSPSALAATEVAAGRSESQPRRSLASITDDELMQAMDENGWQISGAAQQMGISRPSLYKLIVAHPAIRAAAVIPHEEIRAALAAQGQDVGRCAAQLKTPAEALRRHLRASGLEQPAA